MKRILLLLGLFIILSVSNAFAEEQSDISVTAKVKPQSSDYQFELTATDDKSSFPQNTKIGYRITYGVAESAAFDTPVTLVANWRASDAMTNVNVIDYVLGSATNAYNNTSPVVDLVNREIRWTISSVPAGRIDQTVQFDVRTNSYYTGNNEIPFTIAANMNTDDVAMDEQIVTKKFRYNTNYVSPDSSTPTPTPQVSQTPIPTPIESPTAPLSFGKISLTHLIQDSTTIRFTTTNPVSNITIRYGTAANNLSRVLTLDGGQGTTQTIDLEKLLPEKNYYFQITITDGKQSVTSEIFMFKTAKVSTPPNGDNNVFIITSNGTILVSDVKEKNRSGDAIALITTDTPYEITYRLRKDISLKSIDAVMRQTTSGGKLSKVLAANEYVVAMQEKEPLIYVARLRTDIPGNYDILIRMQDTNGNLIEEKVGAIKVMSLLSVLDNKTQAPIDDARIFISFFNKRSNRFEPISPARFENVANPSYTNINGKAKLLLPPGKYRIAISAFGYAQKSIDFVLGPNAGEDFPEVLLQKDQANIFGYLKYYGNAITDLINSLTSVVANLSFSVRFFNLLSTMVIFTTICFTYLLFALRTRIHLKHIFPFFTHHLKTITRRQPLGTFCATITDEYGARIKGALISILDDTSGELITSIMSNTVGICYLNNPQEHKNLKLLIIKDGYMPKTVAVESDIADTPRGLTIVLKRGHKPANPALANAWLLITTIAGRFFEVSLFVSLVLELFFLSVYGLNRTLPFFALSLFNLLLWIFYQHEKQSRKVFKKT